MGRSSRRGVGTQSWGKANPNLSSSAWYPANKELDREQFCTIERVNSKADFRDQAWPRFNKAEMTIFY